MLGGRRVGGLMRSGWVRTTSPVNLLFSLHRLSSCNRPPFFLSFPTFSNSLELTTIKQSNINQGPRCGCVSVGQEERVRQPHYRNLFSEGSFLLGRILIDLNYIWLQQQVVASVRWCEFECGARGQQRVRLLLLLANRSQTAVSHHSLDFCGDDCESSVC